MRSSPHHVRPCDHRPAAPPGSPLRDVHASHRNPVCAQVLVATSSPALPWLRCHGGCGCDAPCCVCLPACPAGVGSACRPTLGACRLSATCPKPALCAPVPRLRHGPPAVRSTRCVLAMLCRPSRRLGGTGWTARGSHTARVPHPLPLPLPFATEAAHLAAGEPSVTSLCVAPDLTAFLHRPAMPYACWPAARYSPVFGPVGPRTTRPPAPCSPSSAGVDPQLGADRCPVLPRRVLGPAIIPYLMCSCLCSAGLRLLGLKSGPTSLVMPPLCHTVCTHPAPVPASV